MGAVKTRLNVVKMKTVIERVKSRESKKHYTFSLTPTVKDALHRYCKANGVKESPVLEEIIRDTVPSEYFK